MSLTPPVDPRCTSKARISLYPLALTSWLARNAAATSVPEAIYTLGHGRAFRSLQIGRVIRHEQESFVLHGRLQGEERETSIGLTKDKLRQQVRIDGTFDGHKVAELAHLMPMQLITPEGFTLSMAAPNTEEHWTGDVFTMKSDFFTAWSNLKRSYRAAQCSAAPGGRYEQLRPWDKELIPLAEQISTGRASNAPVSRRIYGGYLPAVSFPSFRSSLPARLGERD